MVKRSAKRAKSLPWGSVSGYDMARAWSVAMSDGGSGSVVDLDGGGYAVPVHRNREIRPPSKTKPIAARVPGGLVRLLPRGGSWVVVAKKTKNSWMPVDRAPPSHAIGRKRIGRSTARHDPGPGGRRTKDLEREIAAALRQR